MTLLYAPQSQYHKPVSKQPAWVANRGPSDHESHVLCMSTPNEDRDVDGPRREGAIGGDREHAREESYGNAERSGEGVGYVGWRE